MIDARFSFHSFVTATDRGALCRELSSVLTDRVRASRDAAQEGIRIADDLKLLGHDLWSFDESDDLQLWCGDWTRAAPSFELLVRVSCGEGESRFVEVTYRARTEA